MDMVVVKLITISKYIFSYLPLLILWLCRNNIALKNGYVKAWAKMIHSEVILPQVGDIASNVKLQFISGKIEIKG